MHRLLAAFLAMSVAGCLSFGKDIETVAPTKEQVDRCRSEMHLSPSVKLTPFGFKLLGSGIDDAIWFKFRVDAKDLSSVFDQQVVDTSQFTNDFVFSNGMPDLQWWDVKDKKLVGGQIQLPNARFMNVGAEEVQGGFMVYVMWHKT